MIVILWFVNFVISWFNAWATGKSWNETKANGGLMHFMSWMGAIMSAVGFTWCYMVVLGFIAMNVPEAALSEDVTDPNAMLLSAEQGQVFFDLAYLVIIFPALGSGLAIMTHSWGVFWRRRSFGSGLTAGWNTFANLHNFYHAIEQVPASWGRVGSFFSGGSNSSDNAKSKLIIVMVVASVLGGILTTWAIVRRTARATARARSFKYDQMKWEAKNAEMREEHASQQDGEVR